MDRTIATKFIEAIFRNSRLVRDRMSYSSDIAQLSILQIQTLNFLHTNNNASMREIAEYFHIELPSATSLLNKLVALQLVSRHTDATDRRLVRITLTETGDSLLKKVMKEKSAHFERMLGYLAESEQAELLRLLKKLNEKMEENN